MGMLLVEGIATALQRAAPKGVELAQLRVVAEAVAAGNAESLATGQAIIGSLPEAVVQHGLIAGFGLVMIYGGAGALILAVLSLILFRPGRDTTTTCHI